MRLDGIIDNKMCSEGSCDKNKKVSLECCLDRRKDMHLEDVSNGGNTDKEIGFDRSIEINKVMSLDDRNRSEEMRFDQSIDKDKEMNLECSFGKNKCISLEQGSNVRNRGKERSFDLCIGKNKEVSLECSLKRSKDMILEEGSNDGNRDTEMGELIEMKR
jgi:hypothetical protein